MTPIREGGVEIPAVTQAKDAARWLYEDIWTRQSWDRCSPENRETWLHRVKSILAIAYTPTPSPEIAEQPIAPTPEAIVQWLTENCGRGLPHGEVTDMKGALHALAYVHRQIASTSSYKVNIGQCVSAESGLLFVLQHLARTALSTPKPADSTSVAGERMRRVLADGVQVMTPAERVQWIERAKAVLR